MYTLWMYLTHYEGERACFCNVCKFSKCEYSSHKLVEHEYTKEELENVLQRLQPQMDDSDGVYEDDGYHCSNYDSDEEYDMRYEYY